jgi:cobalt/nickel transport system permease protein
MALLFVPPACPDSPLRGLDPRWKLAALVLATAAASLLGTLTAASTMFLAALFLAGLGRLPPGWYLRRMAALALALFLFVVLLPFIVHDEGPGYSLVGLRVSLRGTTLALLIGVKALAMVTLILVLLGTAPLDATLKAAHSLHIPGLVIQIAVLTYRYLFLLLEEFGRLLVALRVRGYRLRSNRRRFRLVGNLTGIIMVRAYERAERVGQAMRCRGFDGRFRSLTEFRTRAGDVVGFFLITAGAMGILWWDIVLRHHE